MRVSHALGVNADTFPRLATKGSQRSRIIFLTAFKRLEDYQNRVRKSLGIAIPRKLKVTDLTY
jgi:hypothetical protein